MVRYPRGRGPHATDRVEATPDPASGRPEDHPTRPARRALGRRRPGGRPRPGPGLAGRDAARPAGRAVGRPDRGPGAAGGAGVSTTFRKKNQALAAHAVAVLERERPMT